MTYNSNGMILYEGPSLIDGAPIVLIMTGLAKGSKNEKTGEMLQTFILLAKVAPIEANRTGLDRSICGDCKHRGTPNNTGKGLATNRSCYVNLGHAPTNVFKTYHRGRYATVTGAANLTKLGKDRTVRLGTYGDPAAIPSYIWDALLAECAGHTAYTHQDNIPTAHVVSEYMMLSADTHAQALQAWAQGSRTFRVVNTVADIDKRNEILCPASAEAGKRTTCEACKLCSGSSISAKSIAIPAHGAGKGNFMA